MPPPQTIEVILLKDKTSHPYVDLETNRKTGGRVFLVNTDDRDTAVTAPGIPSLYEAWGPDHPELYAISVRPRIFGGADVDADRTGWTRIEVKYTTGSGQPEVLAAEENDAFTEVIPGTQQVEIRSDINGDPIPPTQIEVESTEVLVNSYRTSFPWAEWITIAKSVNSAAVLLPPVFGVPGSERPVAPGQLLARSYAIERARPGLLRVQWRLGIATDWKYRYRNEDQDGNPVGVVQVRDVYPSVAWPTSILWGL